MFGKKLLHELVQYLRRLWPFALALAIMSALACIIVMYDSNPVEITGTVTAIGFFVMTAVVFVGSGFVHAYKSCYKNFSAQQHEYAQYPHQYIWAQILAFMIYIVVTTALLLAGVSSFAWKYVWQLFLAITSQWYYLPEFLLFMAIFSATAYLIPMSCIAINLYDKKRKLTLIGGIITYLLCLMCIVLEVFFLIHSPSTDMLFLCEMLAVLLSVSALVDIRMYLLTYRILKTAFDKQNSAA